MQDRASQPTSSMPTVLGGRYELATRLGEGGMATVYRALDRKTGEHCALKVLLAKFSEKPSIRARFSAEAEAMLRIAHRNVIHVFDVNTNNPRPYFAMELAEGGCLVDWIEMHGPMPPRMACDVLIQICKGIGAAHRIGVIHRDIKPHNILMNRRGVCKITDFGIAQFDDDSASLTQTGSVMGTLGYIAPEQRANAKDVDERTDVYSIGATLYTMLTARTTMDLFFADQEPEMLAGIHEHLIPIVLKSTRYRREDRYPTVRALAKALYHVKASLPEDPPGTPALVLTGESVEGSELRPQDATFEPGERSINGQRAPSPSELVDDELSEITANTSTFGGKSNATTASTADEPPAPFQPVATETSLSRSALLRARPEEDATLDWGRIIRRATVITALTLAWLALFGGVAFWGGTTVAQQRRDAEISRDAVLELLDRERLLPEDLIALGAEPATVRSTWDGVVQEADETRRAERVGELVVFGRAQLNAHAPTHSASSQFARAKEIQLALSRLEDARAAWLLQQQEWGAAAGLPHGAFAVWLGLVTRP